MQKLNLFLFLIAISYQNLFAQANCSIDQANAVGQCYGSAVNLDAQISGTVSTVKWTQISGTPVTITDNNKAKASIIPMEATGAFSFKISAQCNQGSVEKIINHTIYPKPNAGSDTIVCGNTWLGLFGRPGLYSGVEWSSLSTNPTPTEVNMHATGFGIKKIDAFGDFFLC